MLRDTARMAYDRLLSRIEEALAELRLSERKACLKAGLKVDAIRNIRRGRAPRAETLTNLSKVLQFRLLDFVDGPDSLDESDAPDNALPPGGYELVPSLDVDGGLGGGGDPGDDDLMGDPVLLPSALIRGELRGAPLDFLAMDVEGQSMEPVLESGDRILIDRRKTNPSQGGLFVIWDGNGLVAKWLERVPDSDPPRLRVFSENQRFTSYDVLTEEARVIGRVVWFARRL